MTRKRINPKDTPCPDYKLLLPKSLADFLHQKQDERYSKFEAFRYLIELQAALGLGIENDAQSQICITITQLSEDWGWHRHTVSAFLDELVKMGYMTKEKGGDGFKLSFSPELFQCIA